MSFHGKSFQCNDCCFVRIRAYTISTFKPTHRVRTALSNQNSRTFQGQVLIFQGLKITEVQGSATLTHIFPLYKAHVTAHMLH